MTQQHFDHLIIGFGKAGKTLAVALAKAGKSVALIERSKAMYGGTCINIGCIPSKKLSFLSDTTDLKSAVTQKNDLTSKLNRANYDNVASHCPVIDGTAKFIDPHTVKVVETEQLISADFIYINTGASNWQPPIDGLADSRFVYDSTTIMELKERPKRLVIIGGGYIGLEFAFSFAHFGTQVTLLEAGDTFLPKEDGDIAQCLLDIMQKRNISVSTSQHINAIKDQDTHAVISTNDGELSCDAILVATGRRANTDLDLQKAGVDLDDKGHIAVNSKRQTSQSHIYAMGDVAGTAQFTYMSLDDYRIVKSQILGDGSYTAKGRRFAYAVFTKPPLANTGLNEKTAKDQGYNVKTNTLKASDIPQAKILTQTDGLLKAVVDADTDQVLGVQLLCHDAHELINFADLAIRQQMRYQDLRDYIFTHPTMMESFNLLFDMEE